MRETLCVVIFALFTAAVLYEETVAIDRVLRRPITSSRTIRIPRGRSEIEWPEDIPGWVDWPGAP